MDYRTAASWVGSKVGASVRPKAGHLADMMDDLRVANSVDELGAMLVDTRGRLMAVKMVGERALTLVVQMVAWMVDPWAAQLAVEWVDS